MKSKERVLTSFANQEPDRVPINYLANPGIDRCLKKYYGIGINNDEVLLDMLGVDFRGINVPYIGPKLHEDVPERMVSTEWGYHTRWIEHKSGGYWDYCDFPLKDADVEMVANWPMPSPDDYNYDIVPYMCSKYKQYAIYIGNAGFGDIINTNGFLRGTEQALVDLALGEPAGLLLTHRRIEIQLEILSRILEKATGGVDFLWIGEDLGTQYSQMISTDLFRKYIRPMHQKFVDLAKSYCIPVMIHSCGSSSWAFEDFIEMGINVVDTLQPEAENMSPVYLKENYGGRLAFHGCISTAGSLSYGRVDDIINDVKKTLEIMMPGGGYCLSPTHLIQDNTPTENAVAMYETVKKYGNYQ